MRRMTLIWGVSTREPSVDICSTRALIVLNFAETLTSATLSFAGLTKRESGFHERIVENTDDRQMSADYGMSSEARYISAKFGDLQL